MHLNCVAGKSIYHANVCVSSKIAYPIVKYVAITHIDWYKCCIQLNS